MLYSPKFNKEWNKSLVWNLDFVNSSLGKQNAMPPKKLIVPRACSCEFFFTGIHPTLG